MRKLKHNALSLCAAVVAGSSCLGTAVAGPFSPVSLSVYGLQNANQLTDVYYNLTSADPAVLAPSEFSHVLLKSSEDPCILDKTCDFDVEAQNFFDGPLTVISESESHGVTAGLSIGHKPYLSSQIQFENSETGRTEVVRATGSTLYRPDLTVTEIDHDVAVVGHRLKIKAKVAELMGDLGANANVTLSFNGEVLDDDGISVVAGDNDNASLKAIMPNVPGLYSYTVNVNDVEPGDYDYSNNSYTFDINVISVSDYLALNDDLNHVFDIESLPSITLTFSVDEWNKELDHFDQNKRHEEKVKASFTFEKDGVVEHLDEVGFRIRGNEYSRMRPEGVPGVPHDPVAPNWNQAHFKVDFNKYNDDQRFHDLRGMNLKFFKDQGLYVREVYSYDLFKRFGVWTAPYSSYARVYVKVLETDGSETVGYYGVYNMFESLDKEYIQDRFDSKNDDGYLWKNLWPSDLNANYLDEANIGVEDIYLDESLSYRPDYDLKTNKSDLENAKAQLVAFMASTTEKEGDEFVDWAESAFDIDLFLKAYAVNVMLGMWDDYWINTNNWYLYFDERGKAYFIPYDYDNVLGTSSLIGNSGTQNVMQWGPMNASRPLVYKILNVPAYREQYKAYILELIDSNNDFFHFDASYDRIAQYHALIGASIANDTGDNMALVDVPAQWGNADFYRLLTGDDSGQAPEANWFKTRARFAYEQVVADTGPMEIPVIDDTIYVRGSFNDWSTNNEMTRIGDTYYAEVYVSKNIHQFKIANASWANYMNFGASTPFTNAQVDSNFPMYAQMTDSNLSNVNLAIGGSGVYGFWFDVSDHDAPVLTVTLVEADPDADLGAFPSDIYLRGGFNGWGASDDFKFTPDESGNIYTLTAELGAGTYQFKIADAAWSQTNLGDGSGVAVTVDSTVDLVAGGGNFVLEIPENDSYTFVIDATAGADNATLTLKYATAYANDIYVRGGFNDWSASDAGKMTPDTKGNVYTVDIAIDPGSYEFKVAESNWSDPNIGAGTDGQDVMLGLPLVLNNGGNPPNLKISIAVSAVYRFTLDANDPIAPTLLIEQL